MYAGKGEADTDVQQDDFRVDAMLRRNMRKAWLDLLL